MLKNKRSGLQDAQKNDVRDNADIFKIFITTYLIVFRFDVKQRDSIFYDY